MRRIDDINTPIIVEYCDIKVSYSLSDKSDGLVDDEVPEANILAISIESNRGERCTVYIIKGVKISLFFLTKVLLDELICTGKI